MKPATIRIDLLPWRERRAAERRQAFYGALVGGVVLAMAVGMGASWWLDAVLERQQARNRFLEEEIKTLEAQIKDIQRLKELVAGIVARKNVIESLQQQRAEAVAVLDALPQVLPEGVFLESLQRKGTALTLKGVARSNGVVSETMRALEASEVCGQVRLIESQAAELAGQPVVRFALAVEIDAAAIGQRLTLPQEGRS